ncbi:unnamed protein product [Prunus armeniaca]
MEGRQRFNLERGCASEGGVEGIPRFKRMFQSHKTAKSLTWHAARKSVDGQMSHPVDSPSWKLVDDKWPEFGKEPRNLRLALSFDGFNPHSSLVADIVVGHPKQPGNDIDVYLEPLIDDLKSLWDGIRGVHRKWLPINHPYQRQRAAFNGKPEYGMPPEPLNGEEVLHIVEDINYIWGLKNGRSVGEDDGDRVCWKKKSKFFDLEYWKYFHVRHVLDVMHIEKNVCDSIIGTLLEIPGKNKDEIPAWLDLLNMGVKTDLQPEYGQRRTRLPLGPWNLSRAKKRADSRLLGLKSHDCHTLMQQLLPVAIRSVLEKPARYMKVLKGYVQNRTRPEGCITEQYIAEEAIKFCTEHLSEVNAVGVLLSQKMRVSKLLLGCIVSLVDRDLLNQAHLYVLKNTEEVLPYIEEQSGCKISTIALSFNDSTLSLQVQSELNGEEHNGVSENLRWLAAGPSMEVPSYRSYLINDVKFNTKAQDDVRTVQNSGALGKTNQKLKKLG